MIGKFMFRIQTWLQSDKMKSFALAFALLAVTAFSFDCFSQVSQDGARQVVNIKREWAKSRFAERNAERKVVLFMGDSKIAAGLIPKVFDAASGGKTRSYNMALPGLPLAPHYFLLADYLKHNPPPDWIVLRLKKGGWNFFHFSEYAIQGASLSEVWQYRKITGNQDLLTSYFLRLRLNWPFVKRFFIGKIYSFLPARFQQQVKDAYKTKQEDREHYEHDWEYFFENQFVHPEARSAERRRFVTEERGYYDFRENAAIGGALPDDYVYSKKGDWGQSDEKGADPFVDQFFDLTQSRGIRVLLINDYILSTEKIEDMPGYWRDIADRYDHVVLPDATLRPQVFASALFSDPLHTSRKGSELFTRYVALVYLGVQTETPDLV